MLFDLSVETLQLLGLDVDIDPVVRPATSPVARSAGG